MTDYRRSVLLLQYAAALTGCITVTGYGTIICWSSPALAYLRSHESISEDQSSWIASLHLLGFIIGFFLNPLFVDRIGRKRTLILFAFPQIISWLMIIFTRNHIMIYTARLTGGIGYGGGLCAMTVYMTEIGNKVNRGIFFILIRLSMGLGFLFTTFLGAYFSYQQMNIALLVLPVCFLILFVFMPDSSYFLKINQSIEESGMNSQKMEEIALTHKSTRKEVNKISFIEKPNNKSKLDSAEEVISENKRITSTRIEFSKLKFDFDLLRETNLWKLFSNSVNRKSLVIVITAGLINILSGQVVFSSFGQQILTYENSPVDPKKTMILLSILNVIACLISTKIIENVRRRNILLFCGLITSISLLITGVYFSLEQNISNSPFLGWIPILFISIFDVFLSVGPSNIFYIYQGEFFSKEVKSVAVTIVKFVYITFGFLSVYLYQKVIKITGTGGIFWIFGSCCFVLTLFVYLMAPESQGMDLEEIKKSLKENSLFYRICNCRRMNKREMHLTRKQMSQGC